MRVPSLLLGVAVLAAGATGFGPSPRDGGLPGSAGRGATAFVTLPCRDLVETRGRLVLRGRPFTGCVLARGPSGRIASTTPYLDGLEHGTARAWYPDGAPSEVRVYSHGRKAGLHRGWWPDGRAAFAYEFRDGEHEGRARDWYADGTPYRDARYHRGQESGLQRLWNTDGTLRSNYVVRDGRRYGLMGEKACASPSETSLAPLVRVSSLPFYRSAQLTPEWISPLSPAYAGLHRVADFRLTDQDGRTMTAADLDGRIHVAQFFFVHCTTLCPKLRSTLAAVQQAYREDPRVMLMSYSVMPETDSVDALEAYARVNHIEAGRWHLLTGRQEEIVRLAHESYFAKLAQDSQGRFLHTENVVLVDEKRRIRGVYDGTLPYEIQRLIEDIATLERESGSAPSPLASAETAERSR